MRNYLVGGLGILLGISALPTEKTKFETGNYSFQTSSFHGITIDNCIGLPTEYDLDGDGVNDRLTYDGSNILLNSHLIVPTHNIQRFGPHPISDFMYVINSESNLEGLVVSRDDEKSGAELIYFIAKKTN